MHLSSQERLPVDRKLAWESLNDTEMLKACIPGCISLGASAPGEFQLAILAGVGPIKARFSGRMLLADVNPAKAYTIRFQGEADGAGRGKASARVRLEDGEDGTTMLHYTAELQVSGKIAQVGSRPITIAAQKMASEFFAALNRELAARAPTRPVKPQAALPAGLLTRITRLFKRGSGG